MSKNLIIGIAIAILAIIGFVVYFSGSGNSPAIIDTQNIDENIGVKNLTREVASSMITARLDTLSTSINLIRVIYEEERGGYTSFILDNDNISSLEKAGLVKVLETPVNSWERMLFDFTDKAKPYTKPVEGGDVEIILASIQSVDVSGITETSELAAQQMKKADFIATYKPTSFGEVLGPTSYKEELESSMYFLLYDDGWRVKSITTF